MYMGARKPIRVHILHPSSVRTHAGPAREECPPPENNKKGLHPLTISHDSVNDTQSYHCP